MEATDLSPLTPRTVTLKDGRQITVLDLARPPRIDPAHWRPIWMLVWLYSPKEAKGEIRATRARPELDPDDAWENGLPVADERTDVLALFEDEN